MYYIYALKITKRLQMEEKGMRLLSKERQEKIIKYRFDIDKKRSYFAGLLLRYVLDIRYQLKERDINLDYNQFGKPLLQGRKDIGFNMSHAGDWVVCAFGPYTVGVDVEKAQSLGNGFSEYTHTEKEWEYLRKIQDRNRRERAEIELWTMKESYLKAIGTGLTIMPNEFYITKSNNHYTAVGGKNIKKGYAIQKGMLDCTHFYSICGKEKEIDVKVIEVDTKKIQYWIEKL